MRQLCVLVGCFLFVSSASAQTPTPTERARAIIDGQRALLDKNVAGIRTLLGQMAPDGVVVGQMAVASPKELLAALANPDKPGDEHHARNALQTLFWASTESSPPPPKNYVVTSTTKNLIAGGRADAVWFTFDLTVDRSAMLGGRPFKSNHTFRITELVVDRGGWKVVLFHVDKAHPDTWDDLASRDSGPPEGELFADADADATPLAALATSPAKLAKALLVEPSTIVLGSSAKDRGVGPAAAKLIKGWSKLKLAPGDSLERKTKTWGYAVVRLDLEGKNEDQKMRMFASVIGLPKPDGTWQVVSLHYSRLAWL